jgi:hypothetical protein
VRGGCNALLEIKAPPQGNRIFRMLACQEDNWDLFVALAREKKQQDLPPAWKDAAPGTSRRPAGKGYRYEHNRRFGRDSIRLHQ